MFISSYYRQLSADIKMKNYMIKTRFVSPEGPKAWSNKAGINFMIRGKNLCNTMLYMILQYGTNPADINRFRSHTGYISRWYTKVKQT